MLVFGRKSKLRDFSKDISGSSQTNNVKYYSAESNIDVNKDVGSNSNFNLGFDQTLIPSF
jgi:hypothetical protein